MIKALSLAVVEAGQGSNQHEAVLTLAPSAVAGTGAVPDGVMHGASATPTAPTAGAPSPTQSAHNVADADSCGRAAPSDADQLLEWKALIRLYNATGGPSWIHNSCWEAVTPTAVCVGMDTDWTRVNCSDGRVTQLLLKNNNLIGELPHAWTGLDRLQELDLSLNDLLSGELSTDLSGLDSLHILSLGNTAVSGSFSQSWKGVPELRQLSLQATQISGTLQSSAWSGVPHLWKLHMVDMKLISGNVRAAAAWRGIGDLRHLELESTRVSGRLPSSWNTARLETLSLGSSLVSGELLAEYSGLSNLTNLSLFKSRVSGTLPANVTGLPMLQHLDIDYSLVTGTIPPVMRGLESLQGLYAQVTAVSGSLPHVWVGYSNLQYLYMFASRVEGAFPKAFTGLDSIKAISLSKTRVNGSLDLTDWSGLPNIVDIYAHGCPIGGTLPSKLKGMSSTLKVLDIRDNLISGTIPFNLALQEGGYPQSTFIENNNLTSFAPEFYSRSSKRLFRGVRDVTLTLNKLQGEMPIALCDVADSVVSIDLSSNGGLSGPVPECFAHAGKVMVLDISGNRLTTLPVSFLWSQSLTTVLASDNDIEGPRLQSFLPIDLPMGNSTIASVDLSRNSINADIGTAMEIINVFPQLSTVVCIDCSLTGVLYPQQLAPQLQTLDITDNPNAVMVLFHDPQDGTGGKHVRQTAPLLKSLGITNTSRSFATLQNARGELMFPTTSLPNMLDLGIAFSRIDPCLDESLMESVTVQLIDMRGLGQADRACQEKMRSTLVPFFAFEITYNQDLTCPSWLLPRTLGSVITSDYFLNFTLCSCRETFYWDWDTRTCKNGLHPPHPEKPKCKSTPGSRICDPFAHAPLHCIVGNFYPVPMPKVAAGLMHSELVHCRRRGLCNKNPLCYDHSDDPAKRNETESPYVFKCADGYDRDSLLCSRCSSGYWQGSGSTCLPCHDAFVWLVPVSFAIVAVWMLLFVWRLSGKPQEGHHTLSTVLFWFQLTALLEASNQTNSVSTAETTSTWEWLTHVRAVFESWATFHPFVAQCFAHGIDYVTGSFVVLAVPYVLAAALGMAMLCLRDSSVLSIRHRLMYVCVWLMQAMFLPVSERVFASMSCEGESASGHKYMSHAPYIDCTGGRYTALLVLSSVTLVFFVAGMPTLAAWLVHKHRGVFVASRSRLRAMTGAAKDQSDNEAAFFGDSWMEMSASLLEDDGNENENENENGAPSRPPRTYSTTGKRAHSEATTSVLYERFIVNLRTFSEKLWFMAVLDAFGTRLLLALLIGLLSPTSALLPVSVFLLLMMSFLLHVVRRPSAQPIDNTLQGVVLFSSMLVYLLSIIAGVSADTEGGTSGNNTSLELIHVLVSLVHIAVMLFMARIVYLRFRSYQGASRGNEDGTTNRMNEHS